MLKDVSQFTVDVVSDTQGKSFTSIYQPYSKKDKTITELTYFLKLNISKKTGAKDFATFIHQAMKAGFMPIAGPIFRIPQVEKAAKGTVIVQVVLRKTHHADTALPKKLVYIASPARLARLKDTIIDYVERQNNAWIHPFHSLPYEYFEGGGATREETMDFCCALIDMCDELWVMGISDGTLTEIASFLEKTDRAHQQQSLKILVKAFDPNWKEILQENGEYMQLMKKHKNTLQKIHSFDQVAL